jgi:hypothetical protein
MERKFDTLMGSRLIKMVKHSKISLITGRLGIKFVQLIFCSSCWKSVFMSFCFWFIH